MMTEENKAAPFVEWLEEVVKHLFEIDPDCILFAGRDKSGRAFSSYWNCSLDDIAVIMDVINKDSIVEYIRNNRESILEALNGDDDEETDETDSCADPETD